MTSKTKVGVLFSAGIDSTTQIALLLNRGYDVYPITFDDGSARTHQKQDHAVEFFLGYWGLHKNHINIRYMLREQLRQSNDYVPGWKATMMMAALSYCEARGLEELHMGYLKDDFWAYSDESPEAFQKVVDLYNELYPAAKIKLNLSIIEYTKADLIRLGTDLNVPYEHTFSCRHVIVAGITHCGQCKVCKHRHEAFVAAEVPDPSYYIYDPVSGERI